MNNIKLISHHDEAVVLAAIREILVVGFVVAAIWIPDHRVALLLVAILVRLSAMQALQERKYK